MRAAISLMYLAGLAATIAAAYLIHPALLLLIGGLAAIGVGNALERRREKPNDSAR